jgi:hypothetical protein
VHPSSRYGPTESLVPNVTAGTFLTEALLMYMIFDNASRKYIFYARPELGIAKVRGKIASPPEHDSKVSFTAQFRYFPSPIAEFYIPTISVTLVLSFELHCLKTSWVLRPSYTLN